MWMTTVCGQSQNTNPGKVWHQGCGMPKCKWQEVGSTASTASSSADDGAGTSSRSGARGGGGNSQDPDTTRQFISAIAQASPSSRPEPRGGQGASAGGPSTSGPRTATGGPSTSGPRTVTNEPASTTAQAANDSTAQASLLAEKVEERLRPTLDKVYQIRPEARSRLEPQFDAAKQLLLSDLAAGKQAVKSFNDLVIGLLERLESAQPARREQTGQAAQGVGKPATTTTAQPQKATTPPQPTTRQKNEALKESITKTLEGIESRSAEQRKGLSEKAAEKVTSQSAEEIAALPVADQLRLLSLLKCHLEDGAIPATQRAALAKMYGAIRLDKQFRAEDKKKRKAVLEDLLVDETVLAAQATWQQPPGLADSSAKKTALRRVHELHCKRLGIPYKDGNVVFQPLAEGSSGLCKDTQVKISTNPKDSRNFDDVLDTVIHETTHVYQHALVEQLESGALTVDDPRYAQAWLFKLNDGAAYVSSPPSSTKKTNPDKYAAEYLAYKRQPVEEHAWKAGGEAGRAFDVKAVALDIAGIVDGLQAWLPKEQKAQALAVLQQFQSRGDIREGAAALVKLDRLAEQALEAVTQSVASMVAGMQQTSGLRDADATFEQYRRLAEHDEKMSPRERFRQMSDLERQIKSKTAQGATDEDDYKTASAEVKTLYEALKEFDAKGSRAFYEQSFNIGNLRTAIKLKLEKMTTLKDTLEARVSEARADQLAYDELVVKIKAVWTIGDQMKVKPILGLTARDASVSDRLQQLKETAVAKRIASDK